jgi:hypothetical protein
MDKRFESAIVAKDQEVWNANVEEHSPHRQLLSHEEQGIGPESRGEATSVLLITDTRRALKKGIIKAPLLAIVVEMETQLQTFLAPRPYSRKQVMPRGNYCVVAAYSWYVFVAFPIPSHVIQDSWKR